MQIYIKSKPISAGVSFNDRLNYIAYIVGKGIKCPKLMAIFSRNFKLTFEHGNSHVCLPKANKSILLQETFLNVGGGGGGGAGGCHTRMFLKC